MSHKTKTNRHFNKRDYIVLIILITLTLVWSLLTSQASAQVSTLQNNCFGTGGLSAGLTTFLNSKFVSTWTNQNKCQGDIAVSVTAAGDLLSGNVMSYTVTVTNNGPRWSYSPRVAITANNGLSTTTPTLSYGQMGPGISQTQTLSIVKGAATPTSVTAAAVTFVLSDSSITDTNTANNTVISNTSVRGSSRAVCRASGLSVPTYECDALMDVYDSTNGAGWTSKTNRGVSPNVESWFGISTTPTSGMVAYYSFDASNATDDAGNGNNGTTNAVSYTDGKIGKAAQMNGNGYVLKNPISNFPSTEFTFSFWIKTIGTADAAISYAVPANNNELLLLNDRGGGAYTLYLNGLGYNTQLVVNDGEWHHVTITWKSSNGDLRIYKDGILHNSSVFAQGRTITAGGALAIGGEQDIVGGWDSTQGVVGEIDEVRIYDRAISATEVTSLYQKNTVIENVQTLCLSNPTESTACRYQYEGTVGNNMSGPLPASIGSLTELTTLSLNNNALGGTLPTGLTNLKKAWRVLLASTNLTGTLPTTIGNMSALTQFDVASNNLGGAIPVELSSTSINTLWATNNKFTSLPDLSARNWTQIQLENNLLSGPLPDWIGTESAINFIRLSKNSFTGPIPASWSAMTSLATVWLFDNQLTGSLDVWSGLNVSAWQQLRVENNNLNRDPNNSAIVPANIQARLSSMTTQNLTNQGDITPAVIQYPLPLTAVNYNGKSITTPIVTGPYGAQVQVAQYAGSPHYIFHSNGIQWGVSTIHNVPVSNGQTYTLGFWVRTTAGTRSITPRITEDVNDRMSVHNPSTIDTNWKYIAIDHTYVSVGGEPRFFVDKTDTCSAGGCPDIQVFGATVTQNALIPQTVDGAFSYDLLVNENSSTTGAGYTSGLSVSFGGPSICQQALFTTNKIITKNGINTIQVTALEPVTYDGCQVTITDRAGLVSNPIVLPTFTSNEYGICNTITDITRSDCKALIDLYYSTNGANWTTKTNWRGIGDTTPTTACDWYGVVCAVGRVNRLHLGGKPSPTDTACDWGDHPGNNLSGTLVDSIGNLTGLQTLCMPNNKIKGPLPSTISNLTNLWAISLYKNPLNTTLPENWSSLKSLQWIVMYEASIQGELPSAWSGMDGIKNITLHSNALSGSLPDAWSNLMDTLSSIQLQSNNINGALPSSWGVTAPSLIRMILNNNNFTGPIPASWGNWTILQQLHLHNNNLQGFIPDALKNLSGLTNSLSYLNNNCLSPSATYMSAGLISHLNAKFTNRSTQKVCPGTIGSRIWTDTNTDGIRDSSETGPSGVTVTLRQCTDQTPVYDSLRNGLIAQYGFDTSLTTDDSGNSRTATNNGATSVAGKLGQAAQFDGTNTINVGNLGSSNAWTISFWMNSSDVSNHRNPLHTNFLGSTPNNQGIRFEQSNGGLFRVGVNSVNTRNPYTISPSIIANNRYHVVLTVDKQTSQLRTYFNNVLANSVTTSSIPTSIENLVLGVGYRSDEANRFYKGLLDDVRIYDRALSATEITSLYNLTTPATAINMPISYNGTSVATANTNVGAYSFATINPGKYYLEYTNIPNGYKFTTQNMGGLVNGLNSDVNPWSAKTSCFELYNGLDELSIDAGLKYLPYASCENALPSYTPTLLGEPVTLSVGGYGNNAAISVSSGSTVLLSQSLTNNNPSTWALKTWNYIWTPSTAGSYTVSGSVDNNSTRLEYYDAVSSSTSYRAIAPDQRCAVQGNLGPQTISLTNINQIATIPSPVSYCTTTQNRTLSYASTTNQPPKMLVSVPSCTSTMVVTSDLNVMCDNVIDMSANECKALVTLHNGTVGTSWTTKTNWNFKADATPRTACDWYGVTCAGGQVTSLNLASNNLAGTISSVTWSNFPSLSVLDLFSNSIGGSLPDISGMTALQTLRIGNNNFAGSLPSSWGSTPALTEISMADAGLFTGGMPSSWTSLSNKLVKLNLGSIFTLTGQTLPTLISQMTKLQELYLYDNGYFGLLSSQFSPLTGLKTLQLQDNQFYANLKDAPLPVLTSLYTSAYGGNKSAIHNNCLYAGAVSGTTGTFLDARFKFTSFPVTDWRTQSICDTDLELTTIAKTGNLLTGVTMTYIINYKNLSLMPSYAPQFNITLHSGLALMSGTATVASANRPYTVALPTLMPGQTGQYSFTINKAGLGSGFYAIVNQFSLTDTTRNDTNPVNNNFTDNDNARGSSYPICIHPQISVQTYECESLGDLYSSTNGASWTTRTNWMTSPDVETWYGITLTNVAGTNYIQKICMTTATDATSCQDNREVGSIGNNLSGSIPSTIGDLSQMKDLRLGNNNISGVLPSSFANLDKLTHLVVQKNKITSIGTGLGGMAELDWVQIGDNPLTVIDPSIVNAPKIRDLQFGRTNITSLPNLTNLCDTLLTIGFEYSSNLSSTIPSWLTGCTNLRVFNGHFAGLTGTITTQFSMPSLQYLRLEGNTLNGVLPTSLSTNLVDLRLQDNNFVSTLPTQWSSLTSLQTLNLSNNTIITGTLPSSWSTMTAMRNMNLSGLNLEGQIPSSWSSMTQMRELIAPNMQLDGPLPISTFQSWPLLNSSPSTSTIHNNCMYTGLITSPQTTWLNTFWSRATQKKCSADLQITLTSKSATDYDPGKTITYTINYANNGARWSYEPVVNITLNTGIVLTGTTNVSTTGIKLPILQPGQTGQVIITANKRGTGVGTGIYVNQFVINDPKTLDSTPISGLVAYYSFDESSVVDDTKNNNNGIANNTIFTTGLISKAPQFNGVDSVITIPNSSSLGSVGTGLTISSWIKKDTSYGIKHQKIIAKGDTSVNLNYAISAGPSFGSLYFGVRTVGGVRDSALVPNNKIPNSNQRSHIVGTYENNIIRIYVDGDLVISKTHSQGGAVLNNTTPLQIGYAYANEYFDGQVDDVRIYNRALSASEILQLYQSNVITDTGIVKRFRYEQCIDVIDIPQAECEALMDLYTFAGGTGWTTRTNWAGIGDTSISTACDWFGVTCTSGRVTKLCMAHNTSPANCNYGTRQVGGLPGNNLSGSLSNTLSDLNQLTTLSIGGNPKLTGPLPTTLGTMTSLVTMSFQNNSHNGVIPTNLTGLTNLTSINLGSNRFSPPLPSNLFQLPKLATADMRFMMSGTTTLPGVATSPLLYLQIYGNNFTGTMPSWIATRTGLVHLQLQNNQFNGAIPSWSTLPNLTLLNISSNQLSGPLPSSWSSLTALQTLDISSNQLSGPLPSSWSSLTALQNLRAYDNQLTGTLPSSWSSLANNIQTIDLSINQLTGTLPSSWSALRNLNTLRLHNNQLGGEIPTSWFTGMTAMNNLVLADNEIAGPIEVATWQSMSNLAVAGSDSIISNNCLYTGSVLSNQLSWMDTYFGAKQIKPASNRSTSYYWKNQRICNADLALTGLVAVGNIYTGSYLTYTINYSNNGPSWAYVPKVSATLHSGLAFVNGGGTGASFDLGYIKPFATGSIVVPIKKIGVGSGTEIFTNRFVISDTASVDILTGNNTLIHTGIVKWFKYPICGAVTDIIQSECEALGDFYTAFNGSGWTNKSNWMGTGDVTQQTACDWYGVTCAPSTGDAPQTVTKLCMGHSSNPTAACNLGPRESGGLVGNNLSGSLPGNITDLRSLVSFAIGGNTKVIGQLPENMGELTKLEQLLLAYGPKLSGSLPSSMSGLVSLKRFGLVGNTTFGTLPNGLLSLPQLSLVSIDNNQLTGTLPTSSLSPLYDLFLPNNPSLGGSIPAWFGTKSTLSYLRVGGTALSGALPLFSGTTLYYLDMSNMPNLRGTLPSSWSSLTNINTITLNNNNNLTGTLPSSWSTMTNLVSLNLTYSNFTGSLPSSWSTMTNLYYLNLGSNNLNGTLPSSWSSLTKLTYLHLFTNNFTSQVPTSWLSSLTGVAQMAWSEANLDGPLPVELLNWNTNTSYAYNDLSNNCFGTGHLTTAQINSFDAKWTRAKWAPQKKCTTDLQLTITPSGNLITSNAMLYTISVTNVGSRWAYSPQVVATLLGGLQSQNSSNPIVTFDALAPGATQTQTITVIKSATSPTTQSNITNTFVVSDASITDSISTNNTVTNVQAVKASTKSYCNHYALSIPVIECEALGDLYSSTAGASWTTKTNWTTSPNVDSWFGITSSQDDDLLAHYSFDANNATDDASNGNNGTLVGSPIFTDGRIGRAAQFDGTQYIDTNTTIPSGSDGTVSVWFQGQGQTNDGGSILRPIVMQGDFATNSNPEALEISMMRAGVTSVGQIRFSRGSDDSSQLYTTNLDDDTWHHAVITKSGTQIRGYIDGVLVTQHTETKQVNTLTNLQIGGSSSSSARKFKGLTDDVRIYSRALSAAEVTNLYQSAAITDTVTQLCLSHSTSPANCNYASREAGGAVGNNLSGSLVSTIGNLTNLTRLVASNNTKLVGSLPSTITQLSKLQSFSVNYARLSGVLPSSLSGLNELTSLGLYANVDLSGPLPSDLFTLPKLATLHASSNKFSGPIPAIGTSPIGTLFLDYNQLTGPIPSWIASKTALGWLMLSNNQLTGPIPATWSALTNLSNLGLAGNQLTGPIPAGWSTMTKLLTMDLSNNNLTGTLPSSWSTLTKLTSLKLGNNNIAGEIPASWSSLSGITQLTLGTNALDGLVPPALQTSFPNLGSNSSTLLDNCMYTGQVAGGFLTYMNTKFGSNWQSQRICDTDLQVSIASKSAPDYNPGKTITYTINYINNGPRWSYTPKITVTLNTGIVLSGTTLQTTGITLPTLAPGASGQVIVTANKRGTGQGTGIYTNVFTISDTLTTDTASGNNTAIDTGVIKWFRYNECVDVGDMPQVECEGLMDLYTFAGGTGWTTRTNWANIGDTTPATACDRYGVKCISGRVTNICLAGSNTTTQCQDARSAPGGNNLSGTLYYTIGDFTELTGLMLGSNKIAGSIPSEINNLSKLTKLSLGSNKITSMPSLTGLQAMTWLFVHNNLLSSALPTWVAEMPNLNGLVVYGNSLTGPLPPSWTGASKLWYLGISDNPTLAGATLPMQWSAWSSLREVYMNRNGFVGTLPDSWSALTGLQKLTLDDSDLVGNLPASWSNMKVLDTLILGFNNLTGTLPSSWSGMTSLKYIRLNNNPLTGPLPSSWSVLTGLEYLDIGGAQLTGTLPSSRGSLNKIQTLRINSNGFVSDIPSSWFTGMTAMRNFIAFDNYLGGPIDAAQWQSWSNLAITGYDSTISNNCFYTGSVLGGFTSWMDTYFGVQQIKALSSWAPQYYWKNQRRCPVDLQLSSATTTGNMYTGASMTYTINYQNNSNSRAYAPKITISLYSGLALVNGGGTGTALDLGYLKPYTTGSIVIPIKKVGVGSGTATYSNIFVISDTSSDDNILGNNTLIHTGIVKWFKYPICGLITDISQIECEALGDFYTDFAGSGWVNNTNWMGIGDATQSTACDRFGVTCAILPVNSQTPNTVSQLCLSHTSNAAAVCNQGGWYSGGVQNNNLSGSLPASITDLLNLTHISVTANTKVIGQLPSNIGDLTKLELLGFNYGPKLTGILPTSMQQLTSMRVLAFLDNTLTGSIPPLLFTLPQLGAVWLGGGGMNLTGSLPLTGGSPIGDFYLAGNTNLGGPIPAWVASTPTISYLRWNGTAISGSLPSSWSSLTNLYHLDFGNMPNITGPLPSSWSNWGSRINTIKLNNAPVAGTLPSSWSSMSSIVEMNLGSVSLTGTLPSSWSGLRNLKTLRLNNNTINGEIPSSWSSLTGLNEIDLDSNNIDGPIPTWLQTGYLSLTNGVSTIHNNCMYTGYVSGSFLTYMNTEFGSNWQAQKICATDPALVSLGVVGSLSTGNSLAYSIKYINNGPRWSYVPKIAVTLFSGLAIGTSTGTVQLSLPSLAPGQSGFSNMIVNKNYYTALGQSQFTNVFTIGDVSVSDTVTTNNTLTHTGIVRGSPYPVCRDMGLTISHTECESLMDIYTTNGGTGWTTKSNWGVNPDVNTWFGVTVASGQVVKLNLSNSFDKNANCDSVSTGNKLSGILNPSVVGLIYMTDLCLGNNQLTGALPSIDTLTGLKILSLHHNSIRSLATSINNLSVLEKIDLSYNALNTTIDATRFGNLPALKHLWLDNNQITGGLSYVIRYTALQSVRLHNNKLSGGVPSGLSVLNFVSELRVNNNFLDRDHINEAIIPSSLSNWYNSISVKSKLSQSDISAPVIGNLGTLSGSIEAIGFPLTFTINENSFASGLYTSGALLNQTLSGLYITMTGSSLCQLISSDPIVNHSGVVTVMVYPETDATYTNCSMLVRDRANNSSNTLTLTTFSYIQPPFRLHLMMGGSGVTLGGGSSLTAIHDLSPFAHKVSMMGGSSLYLGTALNNNGGIQLQANQSLMTQGIFRKQQFNDITVLMAVKLGSNNGSLLLEQSASGVPIELTTNSWKIGLNTVAFTSPVSRTALITATHSNGGLHGVRINGVTGPSVSANQPLQVNGTSVTVIGSGLSSSVIGEMIVYTKSLPSLSLNYLESYLALKYGVTLPGDYSAILNGGSVGNIWSSNPNYQYQVVGLGRHLTSPLPLDQSISTSASGSTITLRSRGVWSDGQYVVAGSNSGSLQRNRDVNAMSGFKVLGRSWYIKKTGGNPQFDISMTQDSITSFNFNPVMIVSNSSSFDVITSSGVLVKSGDYWTSSGVVINNNQYVTFAVSQSKMGGMVRQDFNRDGIRSPSEPLIGGVVVKLWKCPAPGYSYNEPRYLLSGGVSPEPVLQIKTTTATGSDGNYLFTQLTPGNYYMTYDWSSAQLDDPVSLTATTNTKSALRGRYASNVRVWSDYEQYVPRQSNPGSSRYGSMDSLSGVVVTSIDSDIMSSDVTNANSFVSQSSKCYTLTAGTDETSIGAGLFNAHSTDISITQAVTSQIDNLLGAEATLTLTATNNGPKKSLYTQVVMNLDSHLSVVDVRVANVSTPYIVSGSSVKIYQGTMNPGQSVVYQVTLRYNGLSDDGQSLSIQSEINSTTTDTTRANNKPTNVAVTLRKKGSSIGDTVWVDNVSTNGINDDNSNIPIVSGLVIELRKQSDDSIIKVSKLTSGTGSYLFTSIPQGQYYIFVTNLPRGYRFVPKNASGSTVSNDSDIDPATNRSSPFTVNGVADNFTIDIGIVSVDPLQQCSVVKSHKLRLGQSYSNFTDSYILGGGIPAVRLFEVTRSWTEKADYNDSTVLPSFDRYNQGVRGGWGIKGYIATTITQQTLITNGSTAYAPIKAPAERGTTGQMIVSYNYLGCQVLPTVPTYCLQSFKYNSCHTYEITSCGDGIRDEYGSGYIGSNWGAEECDHGSASNNGAVSIDNVQCNPDCTINRNRVADLAVAKTDNYRNICSLPIGSDGMLANADGVAGNIAIPVTQSVISNVVSIVN